MQRRQWFFLGGVFLFYAISSLIVVTIAGSIYCEDDYSYILYGGKELNEIDNQFYEHTINSSYEYYILSLINKESDYTQERLIDAINCSTIHIKYGAFGLLAFMFGIALVWCGSIEKKNS